MDCIVVSDDENNSLDDLDLIHASEHIDSIEKYRQKRKREIRRFWSLVFLNFSSSSTREDELLAIQFEINNIDEQIDDLRSRRFQLAERQKQIQQTLEAERNSSKELNSVEKWQRKGKSSPDFLAITSSSNQSPNLDDLNRFFLERTSSRCSWKNFQN